MVLAVVVPTVFRMDKHTTTACYRELGAELRMVRHAAGMTEEELGEWLGWSPTKVSRAERGYVHLSELDVVVYLAYCGVYGIHGADLKAMCREAEPKPGHWARRHPAGLSDAGRSLIYHERTASASTSYEPEWVPGLLQTEAYIRALTAKRLPNSDIAFAVRVRKHRQQILYRSQPASFTFFVQENALRLVVGDSAIMHEQVLSLLFLDGLPHVAIRVVPASAGAQGLFGGSFRLLEFADHKPLVYLDGLMCGLFLEDREHVDGYRSIIPTIASVALSEGQSRQVLATIASDYDREGADRDACHHLEEEQL